MSIALDWGQSCGASGHGKDNVQSYASSTVTNGCLCTVSLVLSQEQHDFLLLPTVSSEVFAIALTHVAQAIGAGPDRRIIVVLDRAGWHSSQTLVIPNGIHLVFLPPYSSELQRGFRIWPLSNEAIAHRRFETLDELRRGCKQSGALLFKTIRPVSLTLLSSTGGLPRFPKRNVVVWESIFQYTPLFVSRTHL